jgi:hypothetical protein
MSSSIETADTLEPGRAAAASGQRVQIVMDGNDDTRHEFNVVDVAALLAAEERFRHLTGIGFRAAALSGDGSPGRLLKAFDAQVEQTLFVPHLKGG